MSRLACRLSSIPLTTSSLRHLLLLLTSLPTCLPSSSPPHLPSSLPPLPVSSPHDLHYPHYPYRILFEQDISRWWAERHIRAAGYGEVDEEEEGADEGLKSTETLEKLFREIDTDGSGQIARDEMER